MAARHCSDCLPAQTAGWRAASRAGLTTSAAPDPMRRSAMAGIGGPEAARTRQEPLEPPARLAGLPTSHQPARKLPATPRRAPERVEAPKGPTDAQEGARSLLGRSRGSHGQAAVPEAAMTPRRASGRPQERDYRPGGRARGHNLTVELSLSRASVSCADIIQVSGPACRKEGICTTGRGWHGLPRRPVAALHTLHRQDPFGAMDGRACGALPVDCVHRYPTPPLAQPDGVRGHTMKAETTRSFTSLRHPHRQTTPKHRCQP